jgi:hypothetical protein
VTTPQGTAGSARPRRVARGVPRKRVVCGRSGRNSCRARSLARALHVSAEEVPVPRKLVTCPETAHLEQIDFDRHPLGLLIRSCSRFTPACQITCARTCAARMDRRARDSSLPPTLAVSDEDLESTDVIVMLSVDA